jgi:hypothetical protein
MPDHRQPAVEDVQQPSNDQQLGGEADAYAAYVLRRHSPASPNGQDRTVLARSVFVTQRSLSAGEAAACDR